MLIDHAVVTCYAGLGGKGCNSFLRQRDLRHPRPDGGDGGSGGSILLRASRNAHTLLDFKLTKNYHGNRGRHAGSNHMAGADGEDRVLDVPEGTQVFDDSTGMMLADLCHAGETVTVARGGAGGKGNHRHAEATDGKEGEVRVVRLELKLIADAGLVGFPNAGKSTLISRLSNARSKVAAYPFTTREAILGVLRGPDDESIVLADIPGLIEGAHDGRGMGDRFLRHIERTRMILHLVDMGATEGRDPVEDYRVIRRELDKYSPVFRQKPFLIVANKMDIPGSRELLVKFRKKIRRKVWPISAATGEGLKELTGELLRSLSGIRGLEGRA